MILHFVLHFGCLFFCVFCIFVEAITCFALGGGERGSIRCSSCVFFRRFFWEGGALVFSIRFAFFRFLHLYVCIFLLLAFVFLHVCLLCFAFFSGMMSFNGHDEATPQQPQQRHSKHAHELAPWTS